MPCGIGHRDVSAEGSAHRDRLLDLERVAEIPHIVRPIRQRPTFGFGPIAPPVAPVIKVEQLRANSEWREMGPVHRMIEPQPTVEQKQIGRSPHGGSVRYQLRTIYIGEKASVPDLNSHRRCLVP